MQFDPPLLLLTAQAGERRIALATDAVARVLPLPTLAAPPGMAHVIVGMATVAGRVVAVLDPLALLDGGAPRVPGLFAHLLLLREATAGAPVALLVDRATDVVAWPADAIIPVPHEASLGGCVLGSIEVAGETVALLAADRLLVTAERSRVAALAAAFERREAAAAS